MPPRRAVATLARRRRLTAAAFLAPMLAVLAVVAVWPVLHTIWFAFTNAELGGGPADFIGARNFISLLADPQWWRSVANTLIFAALSVSVEAALGMVIALALNRRFRGCGLVRAAVIVPWAVPTVVSAKLWAWMLNDVFGIVNAVLVGAGLLAKPVAWVASPRTALVSVVLVDAWKTTPFVALLLLAGLQMIPADLYEAARMDGAGPGRIFLAVTLPLLRPALLVALIFRTLDALRVFDVIYVMAGDNPASMSMSVFARQQLVEFQDVGYGSAAATLLFVLVAIVTVIYVRAGGLWQEA
ncbi:MAG TPA: sugar ABC transporter permease [Acetobacteraceae bacterium]|jgi:trehalose/maltose transport system permease protein|nr:sugar ABC transporter permease [Acetobacteraceae bacterium]